ncbi:hypothetical protein C8R44DRAFT_886896 [Mycena epipterygia]|nr:hypothetical protein C8R44DRAFT_886896 [Mycena epipterygia]
MRNPTLAALLLLAHTALGDVTTGIPDDGHPRRRARRLRSGTGDWASAVQRATAFVKQLTLAEKINVTTGLDILGRCVGNTGTIPRLNWKGLCLEELPAVLRRGCQPDGTTVLYI